MRQQRIHLICNAHLDPVWLWHWEDGCTEALSTYRIAADFCEQEPGFVFNHNEALLYHWVKKYEPALHKRIQGLVKKGSWHIAGGAWLQPDVNTPCGESHIRQFIIGQQFFGEQFNKNPSTAYNFDPFGHPEGFPQILAGCGMDSYLFCRPSRGNCPLPIGAFRWRDRSGAEVLARRADDHYLTRDNLIPKLEHWPNYYANERDTMILWGIGNHGGGPSRAELERLRAWRAEHPEVDIVHSTPETFFAAQGDRKQFPVVEGEIQRCYTGCYSSMARLKRAHRALEHSLQLTERMAALAWWHGAASYPSTELTVAWKDLLFAQFHDILPGSGTPSVERDSLGVIAHAEEICRRSRLDSMLSCIRGAAPALDGAVPVFVLNPHGHRLQRQIEVELNPSHEFKHTNNMELTVRLGSKRLPYQIVKAEHNVGMARVRVVIPVDLAPWQLARIEISHRNGDTDLACSSRSLARSRTPATFATKNYHIELDTRTGLIATIRARGKKRSVLAPGAFEPQVFADLDHSWTTGDSAAITSHHVDELAPAWTKPSACFRLATVDEVAALSPDPRDRWAPGARSVARPLRVIEEGPLRTEIEAILVHDQSAIIRRYVFGVSDDLIQVRDRVLWNQADHLLKLALPLNYAVDQCSSEACYSAVDRKPSKDYTEHYNGRWVWPRARNGTSVAVCSNGIFAHSCQGRELSLTVLRSPAYASFNLRPDNPQHSGRCIQRQDIGQHEIVTELLLGDLTETAIANTADALNMPAPWQVYYPSGLDPKAPDLDLSNTVQVSSAAVRVVAVKRSEDGTDLIVRLHESTGRRVRCSLRMGTEGSHKLSLPAYSLTTIRIKRTRAGLRFSEVNLLEQ
ncbi:MAG: hypothetical protein PF961_12505 [Planctomycetota bacterium]|jgi:alpha-mannosidase|nr:hypothetical protein [Planctomycetota bacterium]